MEKKLPLPKKSEDLSPKTDSEGADIEDTGIDDPLPDVPDDLLLSENLEDPELDSILTEFNVKAAKVPKGINTNTTSLKVTSKAVTDKPLASDKAQNSSKTPSAKPTATTSPLKIPMTTIKEFAIWVKQKQTVYEEIAFTTILRKIPAAWGILNEEMLLDLLEKLIEEKIISGKLTATSLKLYPDSS